MTNQPQILDGTLTIADDGTTWILTASEIRSLAAARERSSRQFASAAFLAVVLLVIVLLGALIAAPAVLL